MRKDRIPFDSADSQVILGIPGGAAASLGDTMFGIVPPGYYWSADETEWATDVMFWAISELPLAASVTLRPISLVVAVCSSTALAIVFEMSLIWLMISPIWPMAWTAPEGADLEPGLAFGSVSGPLRAILAGERTALNLLQHCSGVATLTRRYVRSTHGRAQIRDTRKTLPGLRALEKAAVRAGGGFNHRECLSDAVLIKDNHLVHHDLVAAVGRARAHWLCKQDGLFCGGVLVEPLFRLLDPALTVRLLVAEGAPVRAGQRLLELEGLASALVAGERTALNLAMRLSGVATASSEPVSREATSSDQAGRSNVSVAISPRSLAANVNT